MWGVAEQSLPEIIVAWLGCVATMEPSEPPLSLRFMMKLVLSALSVSALLFGSVSCDSHSFDETKSLHEGMHKSEHGGHETEASGEKPAGEHAPAAEHKEAKEH